MSQGNKNKLASLPFKKSYIRWYDLLSIILLSLFANLITKDPVASHNSYKTVFHKSLILVSAIFIYCIYSALNEKWQEMRSGHFDDPISAYYESFTTKELIKLYICLSLSFFCLLSFFIA